MRTFALTKLKTNKIMEEKTYTIKNKELYYLLFSELLKHYGNAFVNELYNANCIKQGDNDIFIKCVLQGDVLWNDVLCKNFIKEYLIEDKVNEYVSHQNFGIFIDEKTYKLDGSRGFLQVCKKYATVLYRLYRKHNGLKYSDLDKSCKTPFILYSSVNDYLFACFIIRELATPITPQALNHIMTYYVQRFYLPNYNPKDIEEYHLSNPIEFDHIMCKNGTYKTVKQNLDNINEWRKSIENK